MEQAQEWPETEQEEIKKKREEEDRNEEMGSIWQKARKAAEAAA